MSGDFDWLDAQPAKHTGLEKKGSIMRPGEQLGADRVWFTDGTTVWFRRAASNPATLERHERFLKTGDYKHIETQDGVEVYELQDNSPFKIKTNKQVDISVLDNYNVRRQAVLAACRRDWKAFKEIMSYLRERINMSHLDMRGGMNTPLAENIFAEQYLAAMNSIEQRNGPSPGEINKELASLAQKENGGRLSGAKNITIGGTA